jgi:hypothetical protein
VAVKRVVNVFGEALEAKRIYREMHILRMLQDRDRGGREVIALLDVVLPTPPTTAAPAAARTNAEELYLIFE